ncbi:MAG: tetratricopeptide repeat protein [Thermodesulfobacteriota bacterium]
MKKISFLILTSLLLCTGIFAQTQEEIFDNGVLLFKQGQYQKAIDVFSKLIELAPGHADAYKNRGVTYMKQQEFDLAIKDFQTAKELFPELKGLYSNLGVAWYYKKEYAKAIENYDIELAMTPENYVAYFNRALCLAELDKDDEALDDLERTLSLKPDFYWAICYKADLLAQKGNTAKAIETYKEAIKYDSQNAYAKDKLAKIDKTTTNFDASKKKKSTPIKHMKDTNPQNSGYAIQTGAFLNKANAGKMKTRLINMGFDSRVLILRDSMDKSWYLVRSGNYADKNEAQKDFALLKEKLGTQPVVRPAGDW